MNEIVSWMIIQLAKRYLALEGSSWSTTLCACLSQVGHMAWASTARAALEECGLQK